MGRTTDAASNHKTRASATVLTPQCKSKALLALWHKSLASPLPQSAGAEWACIVVCIPKREMTNGKKRCGKNVTKGADIKRKRRSDESK
ncbi:hypothetical protein F2P81_024248 [Scophthalmus maximus]|uniref:Uncharacterized protein n=1 Tax=Scophthalmus maximus TaxID=52904 RepID=A0A6A4RUA5_SCOMX|nr:hypothetical protein F2P81_024248 [Scophthalmus maximus]